MEKRRRPSRTAQQIATRSRVKRCDQKSSPKDLIEQRLWQGQDQIDQINAIYSLVALVFDFFPGFRFPNDDWNRRLEAMGNLSGLVPFNDETERDEPLMTRMMREVAMRRLPRLLCAALVSTLEAILEDVTVFAILRSDPKQTEDTARKRVRKEMRARTADYVPKLAELAKEPRILKLNWAPYIELIATRNVLVHRLSQVADAQYVSQAGALGRVREGELLPFDHGDLISGYAVASTLIHELRDIYSGLIKNKRK